MLDSFNHAKNYENIEAWARRLKTAPVVPSSEQQKKLDTLIVQAVFKQGEQKAAAGEHARGRGGLPARRQGVSERPARRPGLRERRDRGAEGGRHRHA